MIEFTAAFVAFAFVHTISSYMYYHAFIIRRQLSAEGKANGFAEDSLCLAETVASFGTMEIEEKRYSDALKNFSSCEIEGRRSFSFLKLMLTVVLGVGSTALIYCAWMTHDQAASSDWSTQEGGRRITLPGLDALQKKGGGLAATLMLSQSLFAQSLSARS